MSRKGNCLDNTVMENFFGILKIEIFYGKKFNFKPKDNLKKVIEKYREYYLSLIHISPLLKFQYSFF